MDSDELNGGSVRRTMGNTACVYLPYWSALFCLVNSGNLLYKLLSITTRGGVNLL